MSRAILGLGILLVLVACEAVAPDEPPQADIEIVSGAWGSCGLSWCDFVGEARNLGPDCAREIRGLVRFYDSNGARVGAAEAWDRLNITARVGEIFTFSASIIDRPVVEAARTWDAEASWTAVHC